MRFSSRPIPDLHRWRPELLTADGTHIVKVWIVLMLLGGWLSSDLQAEPDLRGLLKRYCFECHAGEALESELDLGMLLNQDRGLSEVPDVLDKILVTIRDGEMPPDDAEPSLSNPDRKVLLRLLSNELEELQQQQEGDPGLVVMPRLTPSEYRNVIRDLTDWVVTDGGKRLPNEGGAGEGFANVGLAQSMNAAQFERYLVAAKEVLRQLRISPDEGLLWSEIPRDPVLGPADARFDLVNELIAWHLEQQVVWGNQHLSSLSKAFGLSHGLYLEAAWRYRWRRELGMPEASFEDIASESDAPISPLILEKWWALLHQSDPSVHAAGVIAQWRALPEPDEPESSHIRRHCQAIETWQEAVDDSQAERMFAPDYELSFQDEDSRRRVLSRAAEGRWTFEIAVGNARQLFLVLTDADDGNAEDIGRWHRGEFELTDGTTQGWQELVAVRDLQGQKMDWGSHPIDPRIGEASMGVQAPQVLQFTVPEQAKTFRVEFMISNQNAKQSSVQALVLKDLPRAEHLRFYPDRYVFGGKNSQITASSPSFAEFAKEIRKRNIAGANQTKIGLNAERNVFFDWTETDIQFIGGPWPDQTLERPEPLVPYYFTVEEAREVADQEAQERYLSLRRQLHGIAQIPHQRLHRFLLDNGWDEAREGVFPRGDFVATLTPQKQHQYTQLAERVSVAEAGLETQARRMLEPFITRAWRKPLDETELAALLGVYRQARDQGFCFDAAVKSVLLSAFTSPHFLYRYPVLLESSAEVSQPTSVGQHSTVRELDSLALASRLSFFLWGSIPDDELIALANAGRLNDPVILAQQASRMLRDVRCESLARDFAGQMWRFTDFESFSGPDQERFPEFTPALRSAMLQEVILFLNELFQHDQPLTNLLDSDFTFADRELAEFYGLQSPSAEKHARIVSGAERGGLVGMSLFLTQTSLPLRTSPVQRGVWIMEDLLGRDLPSPPAGVPALSDDETDPSGLSIAEQLAIHRERNSCATCHNKIDPLGVSLENFDAIGRWRNEDRSGMELTTSATTHDAEKLTGVTGLKAYLRRHQDEVFRHFNRKLLGYALGRPVAPGDARLLDEMATKLETNEFRFSALVETIITSRQFRYWRQS